MKSFYNIALDPGQLFSANIFKSGSIGHAIRHSTILLFYEVEKLMKVAAPIFLLMFIVVSAVSLADPMMRSSTYKDMKKVEKLIQREDYENAEKLLEELLANELNGYEIVFALRLYSEIFAGQKDHAREKVVLDELLNEHMIPSSMREDIIRRKKELEAIQ